ncbi:metallophosphoesterase [Agrococcus sp. DT81.2]|uniref:metallophosphoesterase n=1 Tax=Agrococcus sp. DT81.2 TaxID=3393414 RepID=UPI003CE50583
MPEDIIISEHPRPTVTIAHLTDLHLTADGSPLHGAVDADRTLIEAIARLEASGMRPDAVVLSGDLADRGDRTAYERLDAIVTEPIRRMGAQLVIASGNHDDRAQLRATMLRDAPPQADALAQLGPDAPICGIHTVAGLRIIVLDSSVPGAHWGAVDERQLAWLKGVLEAPAPQGSILVMHHPPMPTFLDVAVMVELRGQEALASALSGGDVRAIIGGHMHHAVSSTFAGIPVHSTPSLAYTQDLLVEAGGRRGQDGERAIGVLHVLPNAIAHAIAPIATHATVGEALTPEQSRARIAASGIAWRPGAERPLT